MTEYQWKTVSVVGFDELMQALDRADRKGYMPDAIKEEWEAFNWKPEQPAPVQEPVANASAWFALVMNAAAELEDASHCLRDEDAKRVAISGAKHYRDAAKALYTTPPQRKPLTDEEIETIGDQVANSPLVGIVPNFRVRLARAIEAAHGIKGEA